MPFGSPRLRRENGHREKHFQARLCRVFVVCTTRKCQETMVMIRRSTTDVGCVFGVVLWEGCARNSGVVKGSVKNISANGGVCVCVRGRWICSSRMKMMTAKQREETKQQTRPSSFKFVQTVWFPGTMQNCHSFEQWAAPRAHCDAGSVLEC